MSGHGERGALPAPIRAYRLAHWLKGFDADRAKFILDGVRGRFRIRFHGSLLEAKSPPNLKSAVDRPHPVTEHIQKQLDAHRVIGPFVRPPFERFQSSPIGLVEKKTSGHFQMRTPPLSPTGLFDQRRSPTRLFVGGLQPQIKTHRG